jgi:hypothetical protein
MWSMSFRGFQLGYVGMFRMAGFSPVLADMTDSSSLSAVQLKSPMRMDLH